MNTAKQEFSDRRQELLEKKKLSKVISDWVVKNKKVFWKYEVSCFYKTYLLKVTNLPEPSVKDIHQAMINRLLSDLQKKQLCDAITNACATAKVFNNSSIDVQIDFIDGVVIAEVV